MIKISDYEFVTSRNKKYVKKEVYKCKATSMRQAINYFLTYNIRGYVKPMYVVSDIYMRTTDRRISVEDAEKAQRHLKFTIKVPNVGSKKVFPQLVNKVISVDLRRV